MRRSLAYLPQEGKAPPDGVDHQSAGAGDPGTGRRGRARAPGLSGPPDPATALPGVPGGAHRCPGADRAGRHLGRLGVPAARDGLGRDARPLARDRHRGADRPPGLGDHLELPRSACPARGRRGGRAGRGRGCPAGSGAQPTGRPLRARSGAGRLAGRRPRARSGDGGDRQAGAVRRGLCRGNARPAAGAGLQPATGAGVAGPPDPGRRGRRVRLPGGHQLHPAVG